MRTLPAGPLYVHSMFGPESIWGSLGRWAHSKRYMEASMLYAALDREAAMHAANQCTLEPDQPTPGVRRQQRAADNALAELEDDEGEDGDEGAFLSSLWDEGAYFGRDPEIFWGRPAGTAELSPGDVASIAALYDRAELPLAGRGSLESCVHVMKEIWVEKVKLRAGSWFLCRPPEAGGRAKLWFGHVRRVVRHRGGDGEERALVEADWYTTPGRPRQGLQLPFDMQLLSPVITDQPVQHHDGPWYMPEAIVPWHCFAMPHPKHAGLQVMLARHWWILRNLSPYPALPY